MDSQSKENLKLSSDWPSQAQTSDTNQQIKALRHGFTLVVAFLYLGCGMRFAGRLNIIWLLNY